ncbi:hypothetical protein BJ742DRAFT_490667 [Cladochytrium replicatum]|nr:hypothetical protein BJ742DRAFT_490667 [Cladochytrium replicatum]
MRSLSKHVTMLAVAALATLTVAQDQCFPLTGTTTCPELATFSVKKVADFTDVATFDTYVTSQFNNNTAYVQSVKDFYKCSGWDGSGQRYHVSSLCYYLVQQSGCTQPSAVTPLCKTSCDNFIGSLKSIFANTTACPATDSEGVLRRNSVTTPSELAPFAHFCTVLTVTNSTGGACAEGVSYEMNSCGFFTADEAKAHCATNAADPCCATMTQAALTAAADNLYNTTNNIYIITGVSVAVLVIVVVGFIIYLRMRRWNKNTTNAFQPIIEKKDEGGSGGKNRITRAFNRMSKAFSLKPSSRAAPIGKKGGQQSMYSPSPFRGGNDRGGPSKFDDAPLPPMPNVSTIRKKTGPGGVNPNAAMPTMSIMTADPPRDTMYDARRGPDTMYDARRGPDSSYTAIGPAQSSFPPMTAVTNADSVVGYTVTMKAVEEFFPSMDDEVHLQPGDTVQVVEQFDDGWAVGKNLDSGEIGAFPMACLAQLSENTEGRRKSEYRARTQSLYGGQRR